MLQNDSARHVQSVHTAFDIVGALQAHGSLSLTELADRFELAKSTIHNYLRTLQSMGYVVERHGEYRLGVRFLTHGMAARNGLEGSEAIIHTLSSTATNLDETIWWIVEEFGRGIFVGKSPSTGDQDIYGRVGKRSYLHTHAPGKAILANASEDYVRRVIEYHGLPGHTSATITDAANLLADLETIRERGYARSEGEAAHGVNSLGLAFDGPNGSRHALGVFRYTHDIGESDPEANLLPHLEEAVADITSAVEPGAT